MIDDDEDDDEALAPWCSLPRAVLVSVLRTFVVPHPFPFIRASRALFRKP